MTVFPLSILNASCETCFPMYWGNKVDISFSWCLQISSCPFCEGRNCGGEAERIAVEKPVNRLLQ